MFEKEREQIERLARMHTDKPKFKWVTPTRDRIWFQEDNIGDNDRAYTAYNTGTGRRVIKEISVPYVVSDYNYAIALHELGHAYTNSSSEIKANEWAVSNALYWNHTMTRALAEGLATHVCFCGKCANGVSAEDFVKFAKKMGYTSQEFRDYEKSISDETIRNAA